MQEQAIQWGAIAVVGSIMLGSLIVNLGLHWREKQHRRRARGFRNMKSMAQQQRERVRRPDWRQAPRATHRGWR
ncbi:hypothetical protein ASD39_16100 [Sphingomonas sp. Root50]|uniref:hypothetical protein n=1 Tax=Sphingomonas sp. Root50 TaxID=1736551 RepID=UPI0006FB0EA3|nr:hypothetical protein [Sphingomonas sp. Root50]KQX19689.1 hypothetical protein ASD17_12900 [Sphingomonas sp. Root1294]KQY65890.1 hypothetical protein ASD39_16100 [Sphingomonas sp. Root50]KRB95539.1 hypothetical protein ASE22_03955 [Sphingomonas sp. Root720]